MKKVMSILLAGVMAASLFVPASAAAETVNVHDAVERGRVTKAYEADLAAAKEIAYQDIEQVSPEMQKEILAARETIINNESWVADGYNAAVIDADGTATALPHFSELFPNWDAPVEKIESVQPPTTRKTESAYFSVYLKNPSETTDTAPFTSFPQDDVYQVKTLVSSLTSSETCNIGYSDYDTGENLAKQTYLRPGEAFVLYTDPNYSRRIGVRASTFSTPGYGSLHVTAWLTELVK